MIASRQPTPAAARRRKTTRGSTGGAAAGRGRKAARIVLGDMGAGVSPYPYMLIFPQDEHERFLIGRLRENGVEIDRPTEVVSFEERGDRVVVRLKHSDGRDETCEAVFLAGCDGAHSLVRESLPIGQPRFR